MILLDLDDTIFQTSSMNPEIFAPAIQVIHRFCEERETIHAEELIHALWSQPIDEVFLQYEVPSHTAETFYEKMAGIDYKELDVIPFADYVALQEIDDIKILVTTGLKELQNAKIDALRIRQDFTAVYIDDPRTQPRNTKYDIFSRILKEHQIRPQEAWVVGDNPDSEIKAAHQLGMRTIQRSSPTKKKSPLADYYIEGFNELRALHRIHKLKT